IARIGWLPDSFGFSAQLPQLLRKAGLEVFVTHKLMWNDTNKFPHTLFIWEGLDGSRIPVHILPVSYSGVAHAGEFTEAWRKHVEKEGPALHAVGLGDGGGGLNPFIAERLKWMKDLPLTPNVEYEVSEEEYLERIKRIESKLPVWRGELYVEIHRGVYTMNHRIKELVSRLERCLRVAETWASIAWIEGFSEYPSDTLSRAWRVLLRNQFHDVLSGTASWEAYREAFEELEKTLEECNSILEKTMEAIAGSRDGNGRYIYIFNSLPWSRREVVSLPRGRYESRGTVILGSQDLGDSVALELEIPGLGYIVLEQASKEPQQSSGPATALARGDDIVLSNGVVEVTLHADGSITLVDNELGWHAIGKESFVFKAHQDKPGLWDAWDIEKSTLEDPGVPLKPLSKPRILLNGPLIACAEIPLGFKSSQVLEIVCLKGSLKIVEISLGVAWKSRGYLLKLWVKPSLSFKYVDCEIPFGVLKRPAEPRDDFERAKYEFPVLRWIDASDGLKGLALLSPTLHGYSVKDGWIGLTIAK
ncbi:MAG: hypothetical protein OWQ48_04595, partial [Desulfurococcus sp.]|nr:hypothetical protein [Desulfurococcus sp.]